MSKYYKVFISQPMRDLTPDEIKANRAQAVKEIHDAIGDFDLIDSYFEDRPPVDCNNTSLWFLGESLKKLAEADIAYFLDGWEMARGCKIEHDCAVAYGINVYHQN